MLFHSNKSTNEVLTTQQKLSKRYEQLVHKSNSDSH